MTHMYQVDQHNRRIRDDKTVPALEDAERFDVWRGGLLDPTTVLTGWRHDKRKGCVNTWIPSGSWWFVCGDCHPDAVDKDTGISGTRND